MNSLSIVGRLSTFQSVHYQRFHCIPSSAGDGGVSSGGGGVCSSPCSHRGGQCPTQ